MFSLLDYFLNSITMYRLMLYLLLVLIVWAFVLSLFGLLPFTPFALIISILFLVLVARVTNTILARNFGAVTNLESVYITALILALIMTPITAFNELVYLGVVVAIAMVSKYILVWRKKHIFNPAAVAVVLTGLFLGLSASWWVGTAPMLPPVLIGGLLIVRKIKRVSMVTSFLVAAIMVTCVLAIISGVDLASVLLQAISVSPLLFFTFVMLIEPQTSPLTRTRQVVYGVLVGVLFASPFQIGAFYNTPELALIAGNLVSFIISPKGRLLLKLKEKIQVAQDTYDYVFKTPSRIDFSPGQFLEWTLGHKYPDSRGSRRFFTIASSPTEETIRIGAKHYPNSSSFKKALQKLKVGQAIHASQLSGEFILPVDESQKLVFIAGGIGVTPFRSMVKYLIDKRDKRDIILLYANKTEAEIAYRDLLEEAKAVGVKTVHVLSDTKEAPKGWKGKVGQINEEMIKTEIPDYKERVFYLSGPHGMVTAFEKILSQMGIPRSQIKTDFFPGYA